MLHKISLYIFIAIIPLLLSSCYSTKYFSPNHKIDLVSEELYGNGIWRHNNYYLIKQDITLRGKIQFDNSVIIPNGVTVTVEPGAVLIFENHSKFIVHGSLIAEGTSSKKILFTGDSESNCIGISFMNAGYSDSSVLKNVNIQSENELYIKNYESIAQENLQIKEFDKYEQVKSGCLSVGIGAVIFSVYIITEVGSGGCMPGF